MILDPRSGEVLSLVSLPAFDPNRFAVGIDRATWTSLNTDRLHPMQNRAIQGTYSPGSTFKIVVATAALEEGIVTPNFKVNCQGGANFYGRYFQCHLKGGHGVVDMRHAIEKSCNVYFYTLGSLLKIDQIHKWGTRLGLGVKSGIDLPNEQQGLVPSTEWKQKRFNEKWYPGETISVSIGQGQVDVTVISLASMMATVANGGTLYTPKLVRSIDDGSGWKMTPPAETRSRRSGSSRPRFRRFRTGCGWSSTRGHRRARPHRRPGRRRKDGYGAGDLAPGRKGGARAHRSATSGITAGSCFSRPQRRVSRPRSPA